MKRSSSEEFGKIVSNKTDKDLKWFFGNYINTDKDIDYTVKKAHTQKRLGLRNH